MAKMYWAQPWVQFDGKGTQTSAGTSLHKTRTDISRFTEDKRYRPLHQVPFGLPYLVVITDPLVEDLVQKSAVGTLWVGTPDPFMVKGQALEPDTQALRAQNLKDWQESAWRSRRRG